jgi:hypothetical protein
MQRELPEVSKESLNLARGLIEFVTPVVGVNGPNGTFSPPTLAQLVAEFPEGEIYCHFTEVDLESCEAITVVARDDQDRQLAILAAALGLRDNILNH